MAKDKLRYLTNPHQGPVLVNYLLILLGIVILGSCAGKKNTAVVKETLVVAENSWDGNSLPPYPHGQPQITVLKYTIPAGVALDPHKHPVINAAVVLKGELEVVDEHGNTLHLKAGDTLIELVNTIHFGRNTGDKPAELIVFYAGSPGIPLAESANRDDQP